MYENQLQQSGLTANQATVYETLLKTGTAKANAIIKNTPLKRGLVYKSLAELEKIGLVSKKDAPNAVSTFEPAHPTKLKELVEVREKRARLAQQALGGVLGQLVADFNLATGKPGVRFFEGIEGIKQVLEDTLNDNPDKKIYTFNDAAGYATYLLDWNTKHYAPKRKRLNVYEKVIVPNQPKALDWIKGYKANEITEFLFIDHKLFPFSTEINIYNNKVSFVTFSREYHIGVIIDNKEIHNSMLGLFKLCWELGRKNLTQLQPLWIGLASRPKAIVQNSANLAQPRTAE